MIDNGGVRAYSVLSRLGTFNQGPGGFATTLKPNFRVPKYLGGGRGRIYVNVRTWNMTDMDLPLLVHAI